MTTTKTIPSVPTGALRTDRKDYIVYRHVYCVPHWDGDKIIKYTIYSRERGYYLGQITHLGYLEECKAS